jgi:hypothetical protein
MCFLRVDIADRAGSALFGSRNNRSRSRSRSGLAAGSGRQRGARAQAQVVRQMNNKSVRICGCYLVYLVHVSAGQGAFKYSPFCLITGHHTHSGPVGHSQWPCCYLLFSVSVVSVIYGVIVSDSVSVVCM